MQRDSGIAGTRIDSRQARQDILRSLNARRRWFRGQGGAFVGMGYSPVEYIQRAGKRACQSQSLSHENARHRSAFTEGVRRGTLRFHHRSPDSRRAVLFGIQVHCGAASASDGRRPQADIRNVAVMALSPREMYQVTVVAGPGFFCGAHDPAPPGGPEPRGERTEKHSGDARVAAVGSCVFGYWTVPPRGDPRRAPARMSSADGKYALISAKTSAGPTRSEWPDDACQASWPELSDKGVFSAWDACGELFGERSWSERYASLHRWVQESRERSQGGELHVVINPCTPFSLLAPWIRRARAGGSLRPDTPLRICVFSSPLGASGKMYHWKNATRVRMRCASAEAGIGDGDRDHGLQSALSVRSEDGRALHAILRNAGCLESSVSVVGIGARSFRCGETGRVCDFLVGWTDAGAETGQPRIVLRLLHAPALRPGIITQAMRADEIAGILRSATSQIPFRRLYDLSQSQCPPWTTATRQTSGAGAAQRPARLRPDPVSPGTERAPASQPERRPLGPPPGRQQRRKRRRRDSPTPTKGGGGGGGVPSSTQPRRSSRLRKKSRAAATPEEASRTQSRGEPRRRTRARACSTSR